MACPPLAEREAGDASVTRHSLLVGVIVAAVTNRQLSLSDICTRPKYIRNTRVAFCSRRWVASRRHLVPDAEWRAAKNACAAVDEFELRKGLPDLPSNMRVACQHALAHKTRIGFCA